MIFKKIACVGFLIISILMPVKGQDIPQFDNLTTDVGLSEGFVNGVIVDHMGFLWLATRDGLNRYDGYTFTVFKNNVSDSSSISNNTAQVLYITKDSTLWIGTHGGLNTYDYKTGRFICYKNDPKSENSLSHNAVYALYEDKFGILWVGTFGGGVCAFDRKKNTFKRYMHNVNQPNSLGGNAIRAVVEDNDGELWVGVDGAGLCKLNRAQQSFTHFRNIPGDPTSLGSDIVLCVTKDKQGFFWVGSWASGITKFDPRTGKAAAYFRNSPGYVNSVASDENFAVVEASTGDFWLATRKGVDKLDPKTGLITHMQHDPLISSSLVFDIVCNLYEDKNGLLWVCTEGGGVSMMNLYEKQFVHYQSDYKTSNSISNNDVKAIMQDNAGIYWVGTRNGLNRIDMANNTIKRIYSVPGSVYSPQSNVVMCLTQDMTGNLWMGYDGSGLSKFNIESGSFTHFSEDKTNPIKLSNNSVYCVVEDRTGRIWVGTYGGGISIYTPSTGLFTRVTIDANNNMQNVVLALFQDSEGIMWGGTVGHGLARIDPGTLKFQLFESNPKDTESISNNTVYSISESGDYLWISTGGSGFDRFDRKMNKFKNYSNKQGLPSNQVRSILPDEMGNLWIATTKGVSRFNVEKETFRNFDYLDGLQSNSFNANCMFKNSKGQLLFGGKKGFNIFSPDSIKDNTTAPNVVITDFKIFNEKVTLDQEKTLREQIIVAKEVRITYWQRNFSFEFSALNFIAPTKNRFKYMMEGYDNSWIETDYLRRYASYTNLPGGEYTFRVVASNNDGVWNEKGVSLKVIIVPPFWKTWWFYGVMALLAAFAVYRYIKHRERKSIAERIHLKQEVDKAVSEVEEQKKAINKQNEELQRRMEQDKEHQWVNGGIAKFAELMRKNKENVSGLAHEILSSLITYIDGVQGGIFVLNDDEGRDKILELVASYGYNAAKYDRKSLEIGEGLVGNCFVDRKNIYLDSIPDDYLMLESGLGHAKPKILFLTPLTVDEVTIGVIELALLHELKPFEVEFIEKLAQNVAYQLYTARITARTKELLKQTAV